MANTFSKCPNRHGTTAYKKFLESAVLSYGRATWNLKTIFNLNLLATTIANVQEIGGLQFYNDFLNSP